MNVFSRRPQRRFHIGLMIACGLTIAGCSAHPQDANVALAYAEKVEAALKLPIQPAAAIKKFPNRRDRRHEIDPVRVSFGEWQDLEACAAGGLIAAANSPLGRVRTPFEKVRHSQSLLVSLQACEATMSDRAWAQFQDARNQKASQVDEERWNAFWTSEAVEQSFGRTTPLKDALQSEAADRWKALSKQLQPDESGHLNADAWYAVESLLDRTASVGEALHFLVQTTHALNRVSDAIAESRAGRQNCLERDRKVIALMRGHYVNTLQPLMAAGDQTLRNTSAALEEMIRTQPPSDGIPQAMSAWTDQWKDEAAFQRYRTAIRTHAERLSSVMKVCGVSM